MMDKLTIMSWLEGLAQDDWRECHSDSEVQEIARQTLAMLKEQEPKNVIAEKRKILFDDSCDVARYMVDVFYHCPSCDLIFSRHINNNIHFCSNCGQAVKWGE